VEKPESSVLESPQAVDAPSKLVVTTTSPGRDIEFSSPMPWVMAIGLSVAIWALIGWSLWRFIYG
jgi:hypothetical protein